MAGLDVHLVLSGPPVDPPSPGVGWRRPSAPRSTSSATADRAEREAPSRDVAAELTSAGRRPYVIETGGSGAIGAYGQVLAGARGHGAGGRPGLGIDRIVLPSATGGTQAGLLVGPSRRRRGSPASPSPDRSTSCDRVIAMRLATGLGGAIDAAAIDLDESQLGAGYGRPSERRRRRPAELLARTEGILVDPIYTAKALAGLIAGVRSGRGTANGSCSGTPAACPVCSSRSSTEQPIILDRGASPSCWGAPQIRGVGAGGQRSDVVRDLGRP